MSSQHIRAPMSTRLAPLLLGLLLLACVPTAPAPTAAPTSPAATGVPASSPTPPVSPAPSPSPTASPDPSPTDSPAAASPTASPTPSPSPSPTSSPSPSPTIPPPPTAPPSPQADHATRLQRALDAQLSAHGMIGLSAGVLFPDGTLWTGTSGVAEVAGRRSVTPDTGFVVGSISKTFVAATVIQLAEEGRLDLDDRLSRWLPDYPLASSISLRQLLNHSSGLFNYFEHPTYTRRVFGSPNYLWEPHEVLTTFQAAPYFNPGAGYHYSNTGFILLGLVIEEVTGRPLGEEYRARFFEPLELDEAHFQGDGPPPPPAAHGYLVTDDGPRLISDGTDYRPTTSAASVAWAAGSIVASAADLATWAHALYGGELLEPASLAEMTDLTSNPYARESYALGTRSRLIAGRRVFGHTGSLRGFAAAMWHFPAERLSVVVLSNRGRIDVNPIADRLAAAALRSIGYEAP
jgi:D-alanyl-D-alanine carboxypeptidase